jgi:hypothetical protein
MHSLCLRVDAAPGRGVAHRPFVRRLLSSSSRLLSVRAWLPAGGTRMALSCAVHYVTAELSDGFVHMFQVQRKGHGLALLSHTLQAPLPGTLHDSRSAWSSSGSTGIRVMSFNIWNYNGNWAARARAIADVIEASGAGCLGGGLQRDVLRERICCVQGLARAMCWMLSVCCRCCGFARSAGAVGLGQCRTAARAVVTGYVCCCSV